MSESNEVSINPPAQGLVIVTAAGEGYAPSPRVSAAFEELSEALAEAEGREVSGFKFLGGLFGGGLSSGPITTGGGDDDNDTVKVKIKPGGSCTLNVNTFMDPGNGADTGWGAPKF